MAEKAFKRKARIKTGPGTIAPGPAAGVHVSQNSATIGQRELGAPYRAGPAFGLGSHGNAGPGDNALNNDGRQGTQGGGYQQVDWSLQNADRGIVIPLQQRQRLQRQFGRDFSGVRLHIGPAAEQATRSLSAVAFTHGDHIWLGNRANPSDESVLSHELTHVVQQGHARPLAHRGAIVLPGHAANSPVYGAAPAIPGPRGTRAPASSGGALQRWSLLGGVRRLGGRVVSGVRTVGRRIANVGSNLLSLGRDALLAQVRRISPEFARLFERGGIAGFLRDLVARGFRALFGGVLGRVRRIFNFGNIGERFRSMGSAFVTIISQLARNDCSGIMRAAERFGSFMSRTFEPITSRIRRMANAVSGFFRDVWNAVGAPVMGFLREIGGAIWESIRGFVSSIGRVIRPVKNALGSAWSRVKGWLGIEADEGTGEGGGLWNWIRDKAAALWNRVKGPLQPILGPLRAVGGVLLVLSPVGPILLVIRAWPYLRQAFQWVRERWRDLNLVVRARQLMANTVLPAIRDGATRVGEFLVNAADWFLGLLARISGGIQSVTGRLRGGILAPLGRVVSFIAGNYRRMVEWARRGLRWAAGNARSLFRRLIEFIQPIMDALRQLAMLVVNPASIPGFVMGTLWRLLPNCLKGPIIDFIIDLLRRLLRTIPPLPQLGILWPFIRAALIGFFDRVRSFATERKVAVSNTVARIVSGASVSFIVGYLRGLVFGLWDAIVGPFEAIRDLFQLPEMIRNFLRSLGVSMCQIWTAIRCFMSTLSARAIGAFDSLMEAAGDLMDNPGRIIELIRCAIQAMLSAVEGVGATIANQLMALFEGPEDRIGESLGRLVGSALLDVVLAFFTAGSSTALTVIRQIAGVLRTIGRNLMRVVRMVANLIPRFLGFIRRIGGMFSRAGSRAGGLLGRIGGFFRRIAGWFRRLMQRVGRRPSRAPRRRPGRRPDRDRRRDRDRDRRDRDENQGPGWLRITTSVRGALARFSRNGATRTQVDGALRRARAQFRRSRIEVRKDLNESVWRVSARHPRLRVRRPVEEVLEDRATRWREGRLAILAAARRLTNRQKTRRGIRRMLRRERIGGKYRYTGLRVVEDRAERDFNIMGAMSNYQEAAEVEDPQGRWGEYLAQLRTVGRRLNGEGGASLARLQSETSGINNRFRDEWSHESYDPHRTKSKWVGIAIKEGASTITRVMEVWKNKTARLNEAREFLRRRRRRLSDGRINSSYMGRIARTIARRFGFRPIDVEPHGRANPFDSPTRKPMWRFKGMLVGGSGRRVLGEVDDTRRVHEGKSGADAIPIKWYKNPASYPDALRLRTPRGRRFITRFSVFSIPFGGAQIRVGFEGSNLVRAGMTLTKDLPGRASQKRGTGARQRNYRGALDSYGYDMSARGEDADHVTDLAFKEGHDRYNNLWPLDSVTNRRGFRWYGNTRVVIKKRPGNADLRNLHSLPNRIFRITGYEESASRNRIYGVDGS